MKKGNLKLFLVTVFKGKMISYIKPVVGQITTTLIGTAKEPIQREQKKDSGLITEE